MADQLSGDLVGDVASERPSGDAIGSMRLNTAHGTDVVIRQTLDRTACFSRISHRQAIDRNLWIKLVCDASTVAHVSGTQVSEKERCIAAGRSEPEDSRILAHEVEQMHRQPLDCWILNHLPYAHLGTEATVDS